jgi:hypothetical protein
LMARFLTRLYHACSRMVTCGCHAVVGYSRLYN